VHEHSAVRLLCHSANIDAQRPAGEFHFILFVHVVLLYLLVFFRGQMSPKLLKKTSARMLICFSVVSGTLKPSAILYIIAYAFLLGNKKELPLKFFEWRRPVRWSFPGSPAPSTVLTAVPYFLSDIRSGISSGIYCAVLSTDTLLQAGCKGSQRAFLPDQLQIIGCKFFKPDDLCQILTPHLLICHHRMDQIFCRVL
jgi:hypothetical protein